MRKRNERKVLEALNGIVKFAREDSAFYKKLYKGLPSRIDSTRQLPVTNKKILMEHYDDWVTDPSLRYDGIEEFVKDPDRIGELYRDKYLVFITSGTTGKNGFFLYDKTENDLNYRRNAKESLRWLGPGNMIRILARGYRMAMVTATNSHFGLAVGIQSQVRMNPSRLKKIRLLSVHLPVKTLVGELNEFQPTILMGYASIISLLAGEQERGTLKIKPVFVELYGEKVSDDDFARVGRAFGVRPYQGSGSTEIPVLNPICREGWYHINGGRVIVEPVDENFKPVAPGVMSHTVLVTNLTYRTQPVIRYDLGDRLVIRKDRCPCGNGHMAVRVQGRTGEVLSFTNAHGEEVGIPALAMVTLLEIPGPELVQIRQTSKAAMEIRLLYPDSFDSGMKEAQWKELSQRLEEYLASLGLSHVKFEKSAEAPEQSRGGKYKMVIPLGN